MRLVTCIAVCLGAGLLGSLMTSPALQGWYMELKKPGWTPPNWLFAPVWSFLFVAMAVAAWLVWNKVGLTAIPMRLFLIQLFLNIAWSGIFFGLRAPGPAFVEITLLWSAILITAIAFWRSTPLAGFLLVPYLIWVSYASALNFSIWRLNT